MVTCTIQLILCCNEKRFPPDFRGNLQCSYAVSPDLALHYRPPLPLALGEYILAAAADQLPSACRTTFAIAAPVMVMPQLCAAVPAARVCGCARKIISRAANRDALVDLTTNVDV